MIDIETTHTKVDPRYEGRGGVCVGVFKIFSLFFEETNLVRECKEAKDVMVCVCVGVCIMSSRPLTHVIGHGRYNALTCQVTRERRDRK